MGVGSRTWSSCKDWEVCFPLEHGFGLDSLRAELALEAEVPDPGEVLLGDLALDGMRAMAPGVEAGPSGAGHGGLAGSLS